MVLKNWWGMVLKIGNQRLPGFLPAPWLKPKLTLL
jgi:hypothetical protein